MTTPPTPPPSPVDPTADLGLHQPAAVPRRIGDYIIHKVIGEGGMGVVYLAEQPSPRRTVALKVIRPGAASPRTLRRFEHEALVLGRLQHPGIAQIYEAGTADAGHGPQPFFAMELVRGRALTEFVRARKLSTRDRLALFMRICDAVQHAHTKGIIHRDLKPANILVDESGQPKVLDFGVARLSDAEFNTTIQTDIGQLIGTLPYMSPEQVGADPSELDTRSDVYALGVILFELLAERPPYSLDRKAIHEAARIIQHEEPTRLSAINRTFRGDIETIVTKALEKDRERRYHSAGDLGADISRYLNDEPISAHAPTALYQLRKFAARHKPVVAGVCIALIMLAGAMIAIGRQASIARDQRDRALTAEKLAESRLAVAERAQRAEADARALAQTEAATADAVNKFLSDMLASADPDNARGKDVRVTDVLENAALRIRSSFPNQPLVEASIRYTIGATYQSLGEYATAEPHITQSLDIRTTRLGPDHADTIDSLGLLASLRNSQGKIDQADTLFRDVLDRCRRAFGPNHETTIIAASNYALFLIDEHRHSQADAILTPALQTSERVLGEKNPHTWALRHYRAMMLADQGKNDEAAAAYSAVYDWRRQNLGEDHTDTIVSMHAVGQSLKEQQKFAEAEDLYRKSIAQLERIYGPGHPTMLITRDNLAGLLYFQNRLPESIALFEEVVAARRQRLGEEHQATLTSMNNLAAALMSAEDYNRAEPLLLKVLEIQLRTLGPEHAHTLGTRSNLAALYRDRKEFANAEPLYRDVLESRRRIQGIAHPDSLRALHGLGELLLAQDRLQEAEPIILEEMSVARENLGRSHVVTLAAQHLYARHQLESGEPQTAEQIARALVDLARKNFPAGDHRTHIYTVTHAAALMALDRHAEAEPLLLTSHAALKSSLGDTNSNTRTAAQRLHSLYTSTGKPEEAAKYAPSSYQ